MLSEHTFVVEKQCPVCGKRVKVVKVKSRLVSTQIDSDYCCHYNDINPYLYHIWVCDGCGFAADEKVFLATMPQAKREIIGNALMEKHIHFDFDVERSVPDGVASMKLAIFCAEVLKAPLARQAGLALRLAWIYRLDGQEEEERLAEEQALELYVRSLETEHYPVGNLTDTTAMYLVGALFARLGNYKQSVMYLSRVIDDGESTAGNSKIVKDARKLWQDVRELNQADEAAKKKNPAPKKAAAALAKPAEKKAAPKAKKAAPKAKKKSGLRRWF